MQIWTQLSLQTVVEEYFGNSYVLGDFPYRTTISYQISRNFTIWLNLRHTNMEKYPLTDWPEPLHIEILSLIEHEPKLLRTPLIS